MPARSASYGDCNLINVSNNSLDNRFAKLDGDKIVWRSSIGLFYKDLSSGEEIILSNGISGFHGIPSISKGKVAWRTWDTIDTLYIYLWDGNETKLITNYAAGNFEMPWGYPPSYHSIDVSLDDDQLAWAGWDGTDYEIFFWDGESIRQITDNSQDDYEAQLNNGQIAWTSHTGDRFDVMFYDGGTIQNVSNRPNLPDEDPHLMNGVIAWSGWNSSEFRRDIFVWDGFSIRVITLPGDDYEPQIDNTGNFITWNGRVNNQYDVYVWDWNNIYFLASSPNYSEISSYANRGQIVFSKENDSNRNEIYLVEFNNEADFDGDGIVSPYDLDIFSAVYGKTNSGHKGNFNEDFNLDENIDGRDLARFTSNFNSRRCPAWDY